ncbi:MAG TPA: adenylate/guanylate cyclase domain-containing protein [Acidobacteriota bacterium]|nr:adenylate/guanylate cyclase domain-containing protein [Acidobacteriota bacterium]
MAISNRKILFPAVGITVVILCLSYYFLYHGTLGRFDHQILDAHFRIRGPVDPGSDIVIVRLDDTSSQALERKAGGWERADFASAVQILSTAGADLIAIDYLFLMPGADHPEQDEQFQSALQKSANVILASKSQNRIVSAPYSAFREQEVGEGFINFWPDEDGTVRKVAFAQPHYDENRKELTFDFPFSTSIALARLYPDGKYTYDLKDERYSVLGELRIPKAGPKPTDGFYINFAGPAHHFPSITIRDVFQHTFDPKTVSGKIVLIGNWNPADHDYYPVPMRPGLEEQTDREKQGWPKEDIQSMYGVEIHANAIRTLLSKQFLAPLPAGKAAVLFTVIAAILIWLALLTRWNVAAAMATSLLVLLAFAFACYRAFLMGVLVPASPVYFAGILITLTGMTARQLQEAADKRHVTSLFGRYVAPNVVKELIKNRDLMQFGGRKQRLTIFFSDVRGFTTMSEKLPPEEVSALLNEYFSRMTRIVFKHGGTLDKFIGDALMAFFGNPIYFEDHSRRAVAMAREMRIEMQDLKQKWAAEGKENSFDIGMGINTGDVVVGNLGSADFFDYTVIGDEVNLACRLESIAARGQIIISENTYREVKDFFEIHKLEPVMVKGKSQPVQIYEVK